MLIHRDRLYQSDYVWQVTAGEDFTYFLSMSGATSFIQDGAVFVNPLPDAGDLGQAWNITEVDEAFV